MSKRGKPEHRHEVRINALTPLLQAEERAHDFSEVACCLNCSQLVKKRHKMPFDRCPRHGDIENPSDYHCANITLVKNPQPKSRLQRLHPAIKRLENRGYIFDEAMVRPTVPFSQCLLPNGQLAIGLLLPRESPLLDKNGAPILGSDGQPATQQAEVPVLITRGGLIETSSPDLPVKFSAVPTRMNRRWSLASLKTFLSGQPPEVSAAQVFTQVRAQHECYYWVRDPRWYAVHALWDIATHYFMLFPAFPLFELRGHMATAKSKSMDVSRGLSFNSTTRWVDPSEATLFRETHTLRPTKYLDEAERLFRFERGRFVADDRIQVINSSFEQGSTVPRQEKQGHRWRTAHYDTYSPTMVGSINGLFGATEDRAIVRITSRPPGSDERMNVEPDLHDPSWQSIRDQLYLLMFQEYAQVQQLSDWVQAHPGHLSGRDLKIWRPILTIAKLVSDSLFNEILLFSEGQSRVRSAGKGVTAGLDRDLLRAVYDLTLRLPEAGRIHLDSIRQAMACDEPPGHKSLSNRLDKLGFLDFKGRDNFGVYYELSAPLTKSLLYSIEYSLYSSFSSLSSQTVEVVEENVADEGLRASDESSKQGDESTNSVMNQSDEYDESVESDGDGDMTPKKRGLIFAHCYSCHATPCIQYDDRGRPTCADCSRAVKSHAGRTQ